MGIERGILSFIWSSASFPIGLGDGIMAFLTFRLAFVKLVQGRLVAETIVIYFENGCYTRLAHI